MRRTASCTGRSSLREPRTSLCSLQVEPGSRLQQALLLFPLEDAEGKPYKVKLRLQYGPPNARVVEDIVGALDAPSWAPPPAAKAPAAPTAALSQPAATAAASPGGTPLPVLGTAAVPPIAAPAPGGATATFGAFEEFADFASAFEDSSPVDMGASASAASAMLASPPPASPAGAQPAGPAPAQPIKTLSPGSASAGQEAAAAAGVSAQHGATAQNGATEEEQMAWAIRESMQAATASSHAVEDATAPKTQLDAFQGQQAATISGVAHRRHTVAGVPSSPSGSNVPNGEHYPKPPDTIKAEMGVLLEGCASSSPCAVDAADTCCCCSLTAPRASPFATVLCRQRHTIEVTLADDLPAKVAEWSVGKNLSDKARIKVENSLRMRLDQALAKANAESEAAPPAPPC